MEIGNRQQRSSEAVSALELGSGLASKLFLKVAHSRCFMVLECKVNVRHVKRFPSLITLQSGVSSVIWGQEIARAVRTLRITARDNPIVISHFIVTL